MGAFSVDVTHTVHINLLPMPARFTRDVLSSAHQEDLRSKRLDLF